MKLRKLQKLGGLSLITGGLLLAIYVLLFNTLLPVESIESDFSRLVLTPHWGPVCALALLAIMLLVFGFMAAYSKLYDSSGRFGLVGYITLTIAFLLQIGQLVLEVFFYPAIASTEGGIEIFQQDVLINHTMAQSFSVLFIVFIGLGVILFGITVIRSGIYSKLSGALFISGAILYAAVPVFLLNLTGIILFALGCSLIGIKVWGDCRSPNSKIKRHTNCI